MGEEVQALSGKLGIDTTDFKTALDAANRQLRVLESGFKASTAALGDWSVSSTGMESRVKSLTSQIDIQKSKVTAIEAEWRKAADAHGETSIAAQNLQIKLNQETERLGRMESELGETHAALEQFGSGSEDAGEKAEDMASKEDQAAESSSKLSGVLSTLGNAAKIGAGMIAGAAAAAGGLAAAVGGAVMKTAASADELVELSDKTGITTTKLQELAFIGDQTGTSVETVTGSLAKLTRSMDGARSGTGTAADAFKQLKVDVLDSNKQLRSQQDVFNDVIDALGNVQNPAERDALAMEIFGKSAMELNPLIKAGSQGMAQMADEAHRVGAVMDADTVTAAADLNDKMGALKAGALGMASSLAGQLAPGFLSAATTAEGFLGRLSSALKLLKSNPDAAKRMITSLVADIAKEIPKMASAGLQIIQTLLQAIVAAIPILMPLAMQLINSLVQFINGNLPMLMTAGLSILLALINGILPQLPQLALMAVTMLVTLATGIAAALPQLIPAVVGIIPQIILTLLQNLPLLIQAALQIIIALAQGLVAALPVLIPYIPIIMQTLFDTLIALAPILGTAALQLLQTLGQGLMDNLPLLGTAIGALIDAIVNGVNGLLDKIVEVGRFIVEGVWQGIQANAEKFRQQVFDFFKGIVDGVKGVLGMHSPSKVFADIGKNMVLGLGVGFENQIGRLQSDIQSSVAGLTAAASATMDIAVKGSSSTQFATSSASSGGGETIQGTTIQVPVQIIEKSLDAREAAYELVDYIIDEIKRRMR